jgi:hypothetical protein
VTASRAHPRWLDYPFFDPAAYAAPDVWRRAMIGGWLCRFGYRKFAPLRVAEALRAVDVELAPPCGASALEGVPPLPPPLVAPDDSSPLVTILYTTKHPGGYDVILKSLALQTDGRYELVAVDESAPLRALAVAREARRLGVRLRSVLPGKPRDADWRFRLYSAYNTGLMVAATPIVTFLNDFAYLPPKFVEETIRFYQEPRRRNALLGYADIFFLYASLRFSSLTPPPSSPAGCRRSEWTSAR